MQPQQVNGNVGGDFQIKVY